MCVFRIFLNTTISVFKPQILKTDVFGQEYVVEGKQLLANIIAVFLLNCILYVQDVGTGTKVWRHFKHYLSILFNYDSLKFGHR